MSDVSRRSRRHPLIDGVIALVTVALAGAVGNLATLPNIPGWYAGLVKPSFNPPNWIFGPVWTLLYLIMAFAFWRILRAGSEQPQRKTAIVWFVIQMALNALWSIAFFGLHNPAFGLIVVIALEIAILATIQAFLRVDVVAGRLLWPYAAWVAFATVLNAAIFALNSV